MAKKSKTVSTAAAAIDLAKLGEIVTATLAGGFVYVSANEVAPLVAAELVETNPAMTDEQGNIATRSTTKGNETVNTENTNAPAATAPVAAPAAPKPVFAVKKGFAALGVMAIKRGGGRGGETYPFDTLEVDDYFFVPNTDARPKAAKSLASTVSSATKRYADKTPARRFVVRAGSEDGVAGAFVSRVE